MVDRVADFLAGIAEKPVAPGLSPREVRARLGTSDTVPDKGDDPAKIALHALNVLTGNSTFNGHPRFFGYITSSAAPLGALADLVAASVNPNCGAWALSPVATEIERQSVRWIAELIGYPAECGGLLVSGGNMANMVCLIAALRAQAGWDVRAQGVAANGASLKIYASAEVHTWLQKGADLAGVGTNAFRSVPVDDMQAMDVGALARLIEQDRRAGHQPAVVVGTAGSVSTGAVDPLPEIAELCKREKLWFHVDGAYGAPAAILPDASPALKALALGDSVAVDPHKWLYAPIEAGCSLVRDPEKLRSAYAFQPPYYRFEGDKEDPPTNFFEWGPQNTRGFRALKVWMTIRQVGREGYIRMISDDIALAREMADLVSHQSELELLTNQLSITTFRYIPPALRTRRSDPDVAKQLNQLNGEILERLQKSGHVYPSNAVIGGKYAIRACIVNFRTQSADVKALVDATVAAGRDLGKAAKV
ncbi:MAG TPA: aspartate aminotransferase family protein [Gemmatimonadaceae bacterium]|nr:aspartate aminotransferase family protein [Gemmatimonadaceae bacterium]